MEMRRLSGYIFLMADVSDPKPPAAAARPHDWARAIMWMVIAFFCFAGVVLLLKSCRDLPGEMMDKTGRVIDKTGQALADVAAAFRRGTITTSFVSYATSVSNQNYFQFATLKQMELFTRTEELSTGFGYIPLPDVVVEARAPVDYTYYLDLNAKWQLVLRDNVIHVFAPAIHFNKPSVDASAITYEVKKGYLKTAEAQENLKKSITSLVVLRAMENIPLVRETGRRETAEFFEKWLAKSFTDGNKFAIKIHFPDEPPPAGVPISGAPLK